MWLLSLDFNCFYFTFQENGQECRTVQDDRVGCEERSGCGFQDQIDEGKEVEIIFKTKKYYHYIFIGKEDKKKSELKTEYKSLENVKSWFIILE